MWRGPFFSVMSCFCPSLLLTSPSVLPRAGAQYSVIWWFRRRAKGECTAWDCTQCPECQIFINVTCNCPSNPILVVTLYMAECQSFGSLKQQRRHPRENQITLLPRPREVETPWIQMKWNSWNPWHCGVRMHPLWFHTSYFALCYSSGRKIWLPLSPNRPCLNSLLL